jgi:molybdate transport system regulatory protein
LWVDINGHNALGPGKVRLLDAIARNRSLAAAAKELRMSYRLAWQHLRLIEKQIGRSVVERRRGGRSGGGTGLTAEGLALLKAYHGFHRDVDEHVQDAFVRFFAGWSSPRREALLPRKD